MTKIFFSLVLILAMFLASVDTTWAQYYGQGSDQKQLVIDKRVRAMTMLDYWDNLSINQAKFFVGDGIEYSIAVVNKGNVDAYNVQVTDYLPQQLSLVFGPGKIEANKISWTIDKLAVNESRKYTIRAKFNQASAISGQCVQVTNKAVVDNDSDTASVFVCSGTTPKTGSMAVEAGSVLSGLVLTTGLMIRKKIRGF